MPADAVDGAADDGAPVEIEALAGDLVRTGIFVLLLGPGVVDRVFEGGTELKGLRSDH